MNFESTYGHWALVIVNTFIVLVFAASFYQPRTRRDWRTFGGFSAFIAVPMLLFAIPSMRLFY